MAAQGADAARGASRHLAPACFGGEEGNNGISPAEKGLLRGQKRKPIYFESNEFKCFCPHLTRLTKKEKKREKAKSPSSSPPPCKILHALLAEIHHSLNVSC